MADDTVSSMEHVGRLARYPMLKRILHLFAVFVPMTLAVTSAGAASCVDIRKAGGGKLEGRLTHKIFAGPPNYEDVRKGDTPEPAFILELRAKTCVRLDDEGGEAEELQTSRVHIILDESRLPNRSDLRPFIGREVLITGSDGFLAHTGHHRAPAVMSLVNIKLNDDPTLEYGTALPVVRAFYLALSQGDGDTAASMIVPEKRRGPFAPGALTSFYSRLKEPLRLIDVVTMSGSSYDVRYTYMSGNNRCDGRATVTTTKMSGANLIQGIRALSRC